MLFEQFKIRNTTIKNRISVPPMVCFTFGDDNGMVSDAHINHYGSIAKGGFGFIVVEASAIEKDGRLTPKQLGLWEDEQIEGHTKLVSAVHESDVPVVVQIHHAGLVAFCENVVSASSYTGDGKTSRALTFDEIIAIEDKFVDTAIRAKKAGYDGVELHGAHTYLLSQFLNERINKRTDAYGQDRTLIVKNITKKIREKTDDDFIIGIRMGAFEPTLEAGIEHAKIFEEIGLDYLSVSYVARFEMDDFAPDGYEFTNAVYGGTELSFAVKTPVFAVNQITTKQQAEDVLAQSNLAMVCIGRGVLVNYNWANDAKDDKDVGKCLYCNKCYWRIPMNDCAGRAVYKRNKM